MNLEFWQYLMEHILNPISSFSDLLICLNRNWYLNDNRNTLAHIPKSIIRIQFFTWSHMNPIGLFERKQIELGLLNLASSKFPSFQPLPTIPILRDLIKFFLLIEFLKLIWVTKLLVESQKTKFLSSWFSKIALFLKKSHQNPHENIACVHTNPARCHSFFE